MSIKVRIFAATNDPNSRTAKCHFAHLVGLEGWKDIGTQDDQVAMVADNASEVGSNPTLST